MDSTIHRALAESPRQGRVAQAHRLIKAVPDPPAAAPTPDAYIDSPQPGGQPRARPSSSPAPPSASEIIWNYPAPGK